MGFVQISTIYHVENLTPGLYTYKQDAGISHCEMRFDFYQDIGIFIRKERYREKSLLL